MKSPIIDRADLQSVQQRTISGVLTLIFWAAWAYLWLPVLALLAWAVGLQQAYKYMIVLGGYEEVLRLLGIYALIILLLGGSLAAWATYNILRYGEIEKRYENRILTIDELARYFRQESAVVGKWQQAQRLYVSHDDEGNIAHVDIHAVGTSVPEKEPHRVK